jgi:hypothetical protein
MTIFHSVAADAQARFTLLFFLVLHFYITVEELYLQSHSGEQESEAKEEGMVRGLSESK